MTIPKVPPEKKRTELIGFATTKIQKRDLKQQAKKEGLTLSELLRKIVFLEEKVDPYQRIL